MQAGLPLATAISSHDNALFNSQLAQAGDQELTEDDEDGDPERAHAYVGQVNESGTHQYFVGQRVNQFAEVGAMVIKAKDSLENIREQSKNIA